MRKSHRSRDQLRTQDAAQVASVRRSSSRYLKRLRYLAVFMLSGLICLLFSVYVYASSYELLTNSDLPIVRSLIKPRDQMLLKSLSKGSTSINSQLDSFVGDQGEPLEIRVPKVNARIFLLPAVYGDTSGFLARSYSAHFFFTSASKNARFGDLVVYTQRDWRSLPTAAEFGADDNIFIDTDKEWRYMYRITEVQKGKDLSFVPQLSAQPSLTLIVDTINNETEIYRAELSSLQSIQR